MSSLIALYGFSDNDNEFDFGVHIHDKTGKIIWIHFLRLLCGICNGILLNLCEMSINKIQHCNSAERQRKLSHYLICKIFASIAIWIYFGGAIITFSFSLYSVVTFKLYSVFLFVFPLQFICSWIFQIIGLYIRFIKGWNRDHNMIENPNKKCIYYLTYKDFEEYRYSKKLNEISPKDSARHKFKKKHKQKIQQKEQKEFLIGSNDNEMLLLQIEEDNADNIAIHDDANRFTF